MSEKTSRANPKPPSVDRLAGVWRRINDYKIVQWSVAYVALAYGIQHGVVLTSDAFEWPRAVARVVPVSYRGIAPDTFTDGVDVVVEGRMGQDGTFHATTLLAKCASRYENAPEKYRDTPGYQAAKTPRA